jgi:hypothetical protein
LERLEEGAVDVGFIKVVKPWDEARVEELGSAIEVSVVNTACFCKCIGKAEDDEDDDANEDELCTDNVEASDGDGGIGSSVAGVGAVVVDNTWLCCK